jgi:hypothetical protein
MLNVVAVDQHSAANAKEHNLCLDETDVRNIRLYDSVDDNDADEVILRSEIERRNASPLQSLWAMDISNPPFVSEWPFSGGPMMRL